MSEIGFLCPVSCFYLSLEHLSPRDVTLNPYWPVGSAEPTACSPAITLDPGTEHRTPGSLHPLPPLGLWDPIPSWCPPSSCPSCFQILPGPSSLVTPCSRCPGPLTAQGWRQAPVGLVQSPQQPRLLLEVAFIEHFRGAKLCSEEHLCVERWRLDLNPRRLAPGQSTS